MQGVIESDINEEWADVLSDVSLRSSAVVDEFFRERLLAHHEVRDLIDGLDR